MSRLNQRTILVLGTAVLIVTLACSVSLGPTASQPPTPDATRMSLEIQGTSMAMQLTQAALDVQSVPPTLAPPPVVVQPTQEPPQPTVAQPTPTQDLQARMKTARILLYEDAVGVPLVTWVGPTLDQMGLNFTSTADIGILMNHLNSGTKWDLIIIAAESRNSVQGEFWDVIMSKVTNDKTALIVEMWYLSDTAVGRISQLTSKCGIRFQKTRPDVESIYTLKPQHPVFTTPNSNFSLTDYVGYWKDKGGDFVRVTGGDAVILAGGYPNNSSDYGLVVTCIEGRVIFQTFSDHDYHRDDIQALWENYVTWVLGNHFAVTP